jgi:hypothetical protein
MRLLLLENELKALRVIREHACALLLRALPTADFIFLFYYHLLGLFLSSFRYRRVAAESLSERNANTVCSTL